MNILSTQEVKSARKPHRCSFCGGLINTGKPFVRTSIAGDGRFWIWKEHHYCKALAPKVTDPDPGEGITSDDFWNGIDELVYELNGNKYSREPGLDRLKRALDHFKIPHDL